MSNSYGCCYGCSQLLDDNSYWDARIEWMLAALVCEIIWFVRGRGEEVEESFPPDVSGKRRTNERSL